MSRRFGRVEISGPSYNVPFKALSRRIVFSDGDNDGRAKQAFARVS